MDKICIPKSRGEYLALSKREQRLCLLEVIAGPEAEKEPVKFVTQALLVAIQNNDRVVLDAVLKAEMEVNHDSRNKRENRT